MKIHVYCPRECGPSNRRNAEIALKKAFIKSGMSPREVGESEIVFLALEGKRLIEINVWDIELNRLTQKVLEDTVYSAFGGEHENLTLNGATKKLLSSKTHPKPSVVN